MTDEPKKAKNTNACFEYLPPPLEMRADLRHMHEETTSEKLKRKFMAQPLVPIGCLLTTGALSYGMYQMKTGNKFLSQRMMRLRILAQGFTVVALLFGVLHTAKAKRLEEAKSSSNT